MLTPPHPHNTAAPLGVRPRAPGLHRSPAPPTTGGVLPRLSLTAHPYSRTTNRNRHTIHPYCRPPPGPARGAALVYTPPPPPQQNPNRVSTAPSPSRRTAKPSRAATLPSNPLPANRCVRPRPGARAVSRRAAAVRPPRPRRMPAARMPQRVDHATAAASPRWHCRRLSLNMGSSPVTPRGFRSDSGRLRRRAGRGRPTPLRSGSVTGTPYSINPL